MHEKEITIIILAAIESINFENTACIIKSTSNNTSISRREIFQKAVRRF